MSLISSGTFQSDGQSIAYQDVGQGNVVILIHGFCSNYRVNWELTGWIRHLSRAGFRVLTLDLRGHGWSSAPEDPTLYRLGHFARDVANLMDHVSVLQASVVGYSMGARIAAWLTCEHPERVDRLVLGGMATSIFHGSKEYQAIARALEIPSLDVSVEPSARAYRTFAEGNESNLKALAACVRGNRCAMPPEMISRITQPTLVVAGSEDNLSGSPRDLAKIMPNAQALSLPRRDHMQASGDVRFMEAVELFLGGVWPK